MQLIPAIDLKDGQCVRLRQGDMDQSTVFSPDPIEVARHWLDQGAQRLHLVDLNGAFAGQPRNQAAIRGILAAVFATLTRLSSTWTWVLTLPSLAPRL